MQNNKRILTFVVALVLFFAGQALGQTKVLGLFCLGKSTYKEVKAGLPKEVKIKYDDVTPGDYGGPGIGTNGKGYKIEGLESVGFGFDKQHTLVDILLVLKENCFNDIKQILSSKYRQIGSYPGGWLLFKANSDYVYLDIPKDRNIGFGVKYLTNAAYQLDKLRERQTVEYKKNLAQKEKQEERERLKKEAAKF